MPPWRVAWVSHSSLVGSERALVRALSVLDRGRFAPLAVLPEEGPLRAELEAIDVPVHVTPLAWWIPATHWSAAHFVDQLEGLDGRAATLAALLRRERAELVHTNVVVTLEGAMAAAALGLPHVWHSRGLFGSGFPPAWLDDVPFLFDVVDTLADAIACVAREVERQAAEHCRRAERRVVHDGLDVAAFLARPVEARAALLARYGIPEGARVVACVGGLQRRKGQLDLVEAAALLRDDVPDLVLALAGEASEPAYAAAIEARAAELGLAGRVLRVGFEPNVRNLFSVADALAHPSHSEGFGLALVEAMAAGLPVVATRCGGPDEIVEDGVSGLLVPVSEPAALAAALRRVLLDDGCARSLAEGAARRARQFDLRATGAALGDLYDTVLAARAAGRPDAARERRDRARAIAGEVIARGRAAARQAGDPPAAPPRRPRSDRGGSWLARLRRRPSGSSA